MDAVDGDVKGFVGMGMKFEAVVFPVAGLMFLAAAVVAFLGIAPPFVWTSTRYAPGYSEKRFHEIKIGATEAEVRAKVGEPLFKPYISMGGVLLFKYTAHGHNAIFFKSRMLGFSNGVVVEKWSFIND